MDQLGLLTPFPYVSYRNIPSYLLKEYRGVPRSHLIFTSIYYYETNKGSGAVGSSTKALVNQVVCEETLTLTRVDEKVPVGNILVPHGSTLTGQTSISVLDCRPLRRDGVPGLLVSLFVEEELLLNTPQGARFPLEFGFLFQEFTPLTSCEWVANLRDAFEGLDCRIVSLTASNQLSLHDDGTFDQFLEVTIQVRLIQEIEIHLPLSTSHPLPASGTIVKGGIEYGRWALARSLFLGNHTVSIHSASATTEV